MDIDKTQTTINVIQFSHQYIIYQDLLVYMTLGHEFYSTQCFGYITYLLNWLLLHEDSDLLCHFIVRNLSIVLRLALQDLK